jgi:PAN domain
MELRWQRMRHVLVLICCSMLVAIAPTLSHAQEGFDRPGGDYANFRVPTADPALCAARCDREPRCRAWSFSYPVAARRGAICWLKSQVTPRVETPCCVSGVRGSGVIEPRTGPIEFSIDRTGGDYRSFDTTRDRAGAPCAAACQAESRCRAWTYVRPGYIGSSPRCYLKERVTRPRSRPCCISGVVR